jgi:membrane-bound acyltransferase YfiQ involved in biofilm formation
VLLAGLIVYFVALPYYPRIRLVWELFWVRRDPLAMFYFGYFIIGWLAALWLPRLTAFCDRHRVVAWLLCAAGVGIWVLAQVGYSVSAGIRFSRPVYTLSVIGILVFLTRRRQAPSAVRFLSDATLAIYLWHHVFQIAARDYLLAWHSAARILAMVAVGLGGSVTICLLSRGLLGPRWSRRLIGV